MRTFKQQTTLFMCSRLCRAHPVLAAIFGFGLWVGATSSPTASAQGLVLAGRLTCTAEALPARSSQPRDLSCRLVRVSGTSATYRGVIKRYGAAGFPRAKVVFTWSVLAPRQHLELHTLEGRYMGTPKGSPRGLVGGWNRSVVLRPLSGRGGTGASARYAVLELELVAMRT